MENALPTTQHKRLTTREIKNEVLCHFSFEKGLLYTFAHMLTRPEKLISMYLNEDRKKVFNPFRYLLFAVAASTLILLSHPSFTRMIDNIQKQSLGDYQLIEQKTQIPVWDIMIRMQEIYMSYQNVVIILSIPVVSLITWKFFRNHSFNFAENMAINAFVYGTVYWMSSIIGLFTYFSNSGIIMFLSTGITFIVSTYLYKRIFKNGIFRSFVGIVISYIPILIIGTIFQAVIFLFLLMLS